MICEVIEVKDDGNRLIRFHYDKARTSSRSWIRLARCRCRPILKKAQKDKERYQTVYSKEEGSAAF